MKIYKKLLPIVLFFNPISSVFSAVNVLETNQEFDLLVNNFIKANNECDSKLLKSVLTGKMLENKYKEEFRKTKKEIKKSCLKNKKDTHVTLLKTLHSKKGKNLGSTEAIMKIIGKFYYQNDEVFSGTTFQFSKSKKSNKWKIYNIDSSKGWGTRNCIPGIFSPVVFTETNPTPISYDFCSIFPITSTFLNLL